LSRTVDTAQEFSVAFNRIRNAALDNSRVSGLTHQHYKYPARFSPKFVSETIAALSKPGELILDPYMGGGTTIVEALAAGRRAVGCDINSLAVFVTRAKIVSLSSEDIDAIEHWALFIMQSLAYHDQRENQEFQVCPDRTRNLQLPKARAIKKFLSLALASLNDLPTPTTQMVARCALLSVSQWALNGRKRTPTLTEFRNRLTIKTFEMIEASVELDVAIRASGVDRKMPDLIHASSTDLPNYGPFKDGTLADLVITSPPYPGIHILYHRWQVDGRRETPAPYWIADCLDGQGGAYYNFGERRQLNHDDYFKASFETLTSIRRVMRPGATIVQMLAFSKPETHLPRYLQNMSRAGFEETSIDSTRHRRIWRGVPNRNWHAELKGATNSAKEVVLLHRAV
jgi:DNA modification methylase